MNHDLHVFVKCVKVESDSLVQWYYVKQYCQAIASAAKKYNYLDLDYLEDSDLQYIRDDSHMVWLWGGQPEILGIEMEHSIPWWFQSKLEHLIVQYEISEYFCGMSYTWLSVNG